MKTKIKDFDIEKAKAGAKVVTRGGHSARILCYDLKNDHYPIVACIDRNETEKVCIFTLNGNYLYGDKEDDFDLFIEEPEFEKGDFIAFGQDKENPMLGIFKEMSRGNTLHNDYFEYPGINCLDYNNWSMINMRLATDDEKKTVLDALVKEGRRWNADKKCIESISDHTLQPFEKVLVRNISDENWEISFFSYYTNNEEYPYSCCTGLCIECIPYEGNEELLGTNKSV